MMNHPNEDSIERQVKQLPKPVLKTDVKNKMVISLMEDAHYVEKRKTYMFDTKKIIFSLAGVLTFIIFSFAMITMLLKPDHNANTNAFSLSIDQKDKVEIEKLIPFRESYVGDNSAVVGILRQLPGKNFLKEVSLSTKQEPYGIHAQYSGRTKDFETYWENENGERIFLYNATTLFILVQNVDEVTFDVKTKEGIHSFQATRKELENFYGMKLRDLSKHQTQWENVLKSTFSDKEKITSFYDNQIFNNVDWTLSPTFHSDKSTKMIGKKGKLGVMYPTFTAKQYGKYLWGFWGNANELQGNVKIVGMKKGSGTITKVLNSEGVAVWEGGPLLGPIHGADQHTPCNMLFPSSGIWCLYVYLNNKPFDYIVVKVQ
ncbi:DUF4871 domain-containing protein [Bacillus sp. FJAT-49736]|uniref:DUF4871 domain-containing protein n=1 Tax=Bacillus sp. FJAT-49736 TaxID=2833582 RepID=UPI001BC959AB|nr:DUF4871 domain-containing protein [Bacillus sp. FJAT-49736]MBS4174932.1 DUF4871 domain-containing protein [Bacillus sp. FJAT-49736]